MSPVENCWEEGLPERLPADERVLWQGRPSWLALARRGFHLGGLAVYFAVLLTWYGVTVARSSAGVAADFLGVLRLAGLALTALGLVLLYAWLTARSTRYTITDRRVVMHIGIAMPITFNLPFRRIEAAGLRPFGTGHGDIALRLAAPERLSYLVLWPHARPWRMARTEPTLRCVPEAGRVAQILSRALASSAGMPIPAGADVARPETIRAGTPVPA